MDREKTIMGMLLILFLLCWPAVGQDAPPDIDAIGPNQPFVFPQAMPQATAIVSYTIGTLGEEINITEFEKQFQEECAALGIAFNLTQNNSTEDRQ